MNTTVRIAGITLNPKKRIEIALLGIYGIGIPRAKKLLKEASIDPNTHTKDLTDQDVAKLRNAIERGTLTIEGDLRREIISNIRRLKEIGAYRGSRHARNLPTRGQRTRTNSRTVRGNVRRTMASGRRTMTKT